MPMGSHQINNITRLTMDIWKDQVFFNEKPFPAGFFATAAMNVSGDTYDDLREASFELLFLLDKWRKNEQTDIKVLYPQLLSAGKKVLEQVWNIPPYFYLDRSKEEEVLLRRLSPDADIDVSDPKSDEGIFIRAYIYRMASLPVALDHFNCAAWYFTLNFLQYLEKRDANHFTVAAYDCFQSEEFGKLMEAYMGNVPVQRFSLLPDMHGAFVFARNPNPKKKEMVFVNRFCFDYLVDFYSYDLFNGLSWGHAPSMCHNCGKYFLTTTVRTPKYCDGIAPQDANYTCRQYGAMKNQKDKNVSHPVYRIFNTRAGTIRTHYRRGKISYALRVMALKLAAEYRDKALLDSAYAADGYARDMEQETLYAEVRRRLEE